MDEQQLEDKTSIVNNRYNLILDRLITSKGWSKQDLANKVGCSRSYISQVVHGHIEAPLTLKLKIAEVLDKDTRIIFPEEKNDN